MRGPLPCRGGDLDLTVFLWVSTPPFLSLLCSLSVQCEMKFRPQSYGFELESRFFWGEADTEKQQKVCVFV